MVSGFVQMDNSISFLTDSKIMLVAKDSNQNIINTDNEARALMVGVFILWIAILLII